MAKRRLPSHQIVGRGDILNNHLSGALLPSHKLQCYSVACLDMPQLEFGDKAVLPPKVLLELQCLKIPTPLLFTIRAAGVQGNEDSDTHSQQFCSVLEFSAPDGQVYLPYWIMQSLHVPEGGSVVVTSVANIPRGIYCRLQPETTSFLDLAADIGPKLLMETALRRYSVLSVNSTIVIDYGNVRYYVRVAELKPASVVSLCGDVDLETDFMPPEGSDPKRPSTGKSTKSNESSSIPPPTPDPSLAIVEATPNDTKLVPVEGYGRRLRDGGYVESIATGDPALATKNVPPRIFLCSLQKAQQTIRDKQSRPVSTDGVAATADSSVLAAQLRLAQGAFTTPGYTLGTAVQPHHSKCSETPTVPKSASTESEFIPADCSAKSSARQCKLCLADVSSTNMEIHTLRCIKNPSYHKFECSTCHEKILRVNESQHQHCPDCTILCESTDAVVNHQHEEHSASSKCTLCGVFFTRAELHDHADSGQCDHALVPCSLCGLAFTKKDSGQHSRMCSSRTERCDNCRSYIKITEFNAHKIQCEAMTAHHNPAALTPDAHPPSRTKASSQTAFECAYCLQVGFPSIASVEQHVVHDCRIAKSFAAPDTPPLTSTNQDEAEKLRLASADEVAEARVNELTRPLLAQGRIRRKGDITALRSISTPPRRTPPVNFSRNQAHHLPAVTSPPRVLPLAQQAGKQRKPKPKPRLNPQLRSLSQPTSKPAEGPRASTFGDRTGPADLCVSGAGSSTHCAVAPAHRSRTSSQARRRPAARLPAPGRLDTLP